MTLDTRSVRARYGKCGSFDGGGDSETENRLNLRWISDTRIALSFGEARQLEMGFEAHQAKWKGVGDLTMEFAIAFHIPIYCPDVFNPSQISIPAILLSLWCLHLLKFAREEKVDDSGKLLALDTYIPMQCAVATPPAAWDLIVDDRSRH